ncbi:MAG TPA: ABC transporter ATP-binding protein, partial [Daejeonella sp.]|nr:ABC transporter ATP-binding protein [Daejeonella sp.]
MLEIDSVSLSFWGRSVLSGCYLKCKAGEVVGLLGRNGSGKSSLLKIMFGSRKADFMHFRINGKIIQKGYTTGQVAYLPQQHFMLPFLKVSDLFEVFSPFIQERLLAEELLPASMTQRLDELSNGQQRFLEGLWILSQPAEFILLDEPFSAISPFQVEFLQQIIIETGKHKGIVLTDHLYRP